MRLETRGLRHDGPQGVPLADPVPFQDLGESLDLGKYLNTLRRRWLLVATALLITVSWALAHYSLSTKQYEAKTVIQIERKRLSLVALGQPGWLEDWWNMEYYPTQYRLLRSRVMAERVVQHLRLWERPEFADAGSSLVPGAEAPEASDLQLARLAGRIQGGLEVRPIAETQLVDLIYQSDSPELAAQIANAYADVFIAWGIEDRRSIAGEASTFLDDQVETLRGEIEERQRILNAYTSSSEFALDPAGEALVERRQTLEKQYNGVVGRRIKLEAAYREIQNLPPETVANTSSGGRVSQLKAELFVLENDYKSKLATYTPEWPEMVELAEQVEEKRDQVQRLIQETYQEASDQAYAEFQKAKREEDTLERELRELAADVRLQNSAALEYTNMVTYIDTRKELLEELLKRQSETEVQSRLQTTTESNVRIVDSAVVPSGHSRPSLRSNLASAVLLGLIFGLGGVVLLEFMDRTVKSPDELEGIFGLPTLTVVPDLAAGGKGRGYGRGAYGYGYGGRREGSRDSGRGPVAESAAGRRIELLPHRHPRLAVCEAYRSLRTALLLSSAEDLRLVAVTSAEPGEGKTATTCNLAVVMAQLGRRVLIVDADLRRPRMHKIFRVPNRAGLVNYLTGKPDLEKIILPSEVQGLSVCPCGPIPPNPSELLASDRMREFLASVRSRFDFVLIDTPPALPVADAVILGPHTDGLVVCARAGVLQRDDAKACRDRLRYAEIRLFGLVFNRYDESGGRYGKRYRYYDAYEASETPTESSSAA